MNRTTQKQSPAVSEKSHENPAPATRASAASSADENHGHGGSYVNTPKGTRVLVERTEQRIPRSVEQEELERKKAQEETIPQEKD